MLLSHNTRNGFFLCVIEVMGGGSNPKCWLVCDLFLCIGYFQRFVVHQEDIFNGMENIFSLFSRWCLLVSCWYGQLDVKRKEEENRHSFKVFLKMEFLLVYISPLGNIYIKKIAVLTKQNQHQQHIKQPNSAQW